MRLAATAGITEDGLTTQQTLAVIDAYAAALAECPLCGGAKVYTFTHRVPLRPYAPNLNELNVDIEPGTEGQCPACAGAGHDPRNVFWHCAQGDGQELCEVSKTAGNGRAEQHADCGWHVRVRLLDRPVG